MNNITFKADNKPAVNYAHVVNENPFEAVSSTVKRHATNADNLRKALTKAQGTDYTLGSMNDTTIRSGSLAIAILASSKAISGVSGAGEFIGFCSWFAAMGISPKIINKMLQLKYGLNLDKEYVDSYGRRKKVFDDPGFICWDVIPKAEIDSIGDKMGIPKNIINRREAIQEKITQVVVQSKTWMMVSAGIATPVIASLIADTLKKPFNGLLNMMHSNNIQNVTSKVDRAIKTGNVAEAREILARSINSTLGANEGSALARLWKSVPDAVVEATGLETGAVSNLGKMFAGAKKYSKNSQ
jgi:hypothetical protein